ncbi:restriction endonuclease subunit S [Microcoleus sp. K1-B6]|uniref:restriction endonuclease subunit S n=1 Tax=unclassified Microcoleus TaxID=2642155 RepID=UPI002FD729AB
MLREGKIPERYRNTDLGIIPNDWNLKEFEEVLKVIDGDRGDNYPSNDELHNSGYCLFLSAKNVTKEGFKFSECIFITKKKDDSLGKGKLAKGDVVLTTRGTVGNVAFFDDFVPFENIRINSGMVILRNEDDNLDNNYLYSFFQSHLLQNQIDRVVFGSAQPQLTVKGINKFKIPLPPTIEEQKAIAQALSDVDATIAELDRLITKKRNIKQGAMQQLLTGEKRLPGFSGEWEVKTFRDVSFVNQGLQIAIEKRLKQPAPNSKKYITIQFLNNGKGTEYINSYSSSVCCNENDVLMTRTGNTGIVVSGVNGVFHNNFFKINFDRKAIDKNYLIGYLNLDKTQKLILAKAGTSTIPDLNHNDFYSIPIPLPTLSEQKAIAQVLSDMDAEIEALEQKCDKYKAIKQGMMQELLTGRTRLV